MKSGTSISKLSQPENPAFEKSLPEGDHNQRRDDDDVQWTYAVAVYVYYVLVHHLGLSNVFRKRR